MGMLKGWRLNKQAVRMIYSYLLNQKCEVSTFLTPKDKKVLELKERQRFGEPDDYVVYVDGPRGLGNCMILRTWRL